MIPDDTTDADLCLQVGVGYFKERKFREAVSMFTQAIDYEPDSAIAHSNLGAALCELGELDDALAVLLKANELAPGRLLVLSNLGNVFTQQGQFVEGEKCLRAVLARDPCHEKALTNLSTALWGLGRIDVAMEAARTAIAVNPRNAMAHKNLGVMLLAAGAFEEGWREYEWRWEADGIPPPHPLPMPYWPNGGDPVLIWGEQGVGDEILHASMTASLIERGHKVVLECDKRLVSLFQRSFPGTHIFEMGEGTDHRVNSHVPAAGLGRYLRRHVLDFPASVGFLQADPKMTAELRARLPANKLCVGIAWASINTKFGDNKTIPLAQLGSLLAMPDAEFIGLQYGSVQQVGDDPRIKFHTDVNLNYDLDRTASLIMACDIIVTISNTVAHLAAALGKPTLVLRASGIGKFWHYGGDGTRSIWYPSVRFFRQEGNDWAPAVRAVEAELKKKARAGEMHGPQV